jgi:hypothetical protein
MTAAIFGGASRFNPDRFQDPVARRREADGEPITTAKTIPSFMSLCMEVSHAARKG